MTATIDGNTVMSVRTPRLLYWPVGFAGCRSHPPVDNALAKKSAALTSDFREVSSGDAGGCGIYPNSELDGTCILSGVVVIWQVYGGPPHGGYP